MFTGVLKIVRIASAIDFPLNFFNKSDRKVNNSTSKRSELDDDRSMQLNALFPVESSAVVFGKTLIRTIGCDATKRAEDRSAAEQFEISLVDSIAKDSIAAILDVQPFRVKKSEILNALSASSTLNNDNDWLLPLVDLANGNKHIELAQHVHVPTLKSKAKGLVQVVDCIYVGVAQRLTHDV